MDDLKPCPFCLQLAEVAYAKRIGPVHTANLHPVIRCSSKSCPAHVMQADHSAWNTRPREYQLLRVVRDMYEGADMELRDGGDVWFSGGEYGFAPEFSWTEDAIREAIELERTKGGVSGD